MRGPWRRFGFAAAILAAVGVLLFAGKTIDAGVVGSPHDFSSFAGVSASGTCSACHIPHGADPEVLWTRSLADYRTLLDANGGGTYQVNYIHSSTIPCYDCHDTHTSGNIDDSPLKSSFTLSYPPQDTAFGGDGPGGKPGYYENTPPYASNHGANKNLNPGDCAALLTTGGHFLKDYSTGTGSFRRGDKLPCRDCHDPHAWDSSRQAFIRTGLPSSGANGVDSLDTTGVQASTYMAYQTGHGTRSNPESRKICARCHGYSLSSPAGTEGTPVTYTSINSAYNSSNRIPRPPDNVSDGTTPIAEHQYTTDPGAAACASCHKHNSIMASCNACHSYPGLDNTLSLRQMSRGHWPHVGKPGTGGTANSMGYACGVCHYNVSTRHNGSADFTGNWWTSVDVQFNPALNPANANGPQYNGQSATGGSYAQGVLNGAANGVCAGLYCHGDNPGQNLMWEGAAKQPKWDNTAGGSACGDCHRAGSNLRQGNHAVHVDNTGINARGPGGITKFSPAGNCSDGTATGCHTAYGKTPTTVHARGTATFRTSPGSGNPVDLQTTQVCFNCHSANNNFYADNGLLVAVSGVFLATSNWWDNIYRLPCTSCHRSLPGNTNMDGSGSAAPNIEIYYRISGHGYPSGAPLDNTSTTTIFDNVNQVLPLPCGSCHDVNVRHFGNTTATGNAWRLRSSTGYPAAEGLDKFCALQCHGGGEAGTAWTCAKPGLPMDHFWIDGNGAVCPRGPEKEGTDTHPTSQDVEIIGKTKIPNEMGVNFMPLDSDIRQGGGTNFLCVTCHDPHGTGPGAASWGRSFAGYNATTPVDNVHMLRYDEPQATGDLCHKCHK